MWIKTRAYDSAHIPFVPDASAYHKGWVKWWMDCQPPWRKGSEWPLPKEQVGNTTWGKLSARGQNGFFLVVMSATWWAASLKSTDDRCLFDEAMDDMCWVLERILEAGLAPNAPGATKDPIPPSGPQKPVPMATWQAREVGKRQSKASRKLMEALS